MKNRDSFSSTFGFLALVSGSIWFGSYVARLIVTYQLFEPEDLVLKSYVSNANLPEIIRTIHPLINLTFFSYIIFIVLFTLFVISSKLKFRENGWLLIISMIVYLTFPLEAIFMSMDYRMIILFFDSNFTSDEILKLITERLSILNSFPIILFMSYLTIPYFLVFKPFTLRLEK